MALDISLENDRGLDSRRKPRSGLALNEWSVA